MVRKRLSDMLREEAQKPTETEINVASTPQVENTAGAAQSKPAAKRRTPTGSRTAAKSSSTASQDLSKDTAAKDETTAIALEVTHLKAELNATAKQTSELNQQVTDLKAELENQAAATKTLQTTLKKAEQHGQQLATELTEAKQTILNLVEVNSQLKQDLAAKQAAAIHETLANLSTGLPRGIAPLPKKSLPETPTASTEVKKNALASTTLSQQELLQRQKKSLAHPVFPAGNSPGHLSEQDLGWVD
ncbi:hypothetical protein AB3R30_06030 [Leptolyngbyaceae cyanobacterium UHCC 1019]